MSQMAIKDQVVTDFLADRPVPGSLKLYDDLLDKIVEVNATHVSSKEQVWQLFFDGASRTCPEENVILGVGVVLISPYNYMIPWCILINWAVFQQRSRIQYSINWNATW